MAWKGAVVLNGNPFLFNCHLPNLIPLLYNKLNIVYNCDVIYFISGIFMKKTILTLFITIAIFVSVAVLYLSIQYSPGYVYRLVRYNVADVFDYKFFKNNSLTPSQQPKAFPKQLKEAYVESLFADKVMSTGCNDFNDWIEKSQTTALIFLQNDTIIYEGYFNGFQRDSYFHSQSVAKSFISALIGFAIQDGFITGVDEPITAYLPELAERDERFKKITIKHLLQMQSGLKYIEAYLPLLNIHAPWHDEAIGYYHGNVRKLLLNKVKVDRTPGNDFQYNNYNTSYLGLIIERATHKSVSEYMTEKLWSPLMEYDAKFSVDQHDFEYMPSRLIARAIDYARFGSLFLNNGYHHAKSILPESWVKFSTQEDPTIPIDWYPDLWSYKCEHTYYGAQWWGHANCDATYQFFASGNLGQCIYVIPHQNTVIVRLGMSNQLFNDGDLWHIEKCIRYATFDQSLRENGASETIKTYKEERRRGDTNLTFDEKYIHNKAYTYLNSNHPNEALALFQLNVETYPNSWIVHKSLGEALLQTGDSIAAIRSFHKALELAPDEVTDQINILKN